jgi:hypothetical protein
VGNETNVINLAEDILGNAIRSANDYFINILQGNRVSSATMYLVKTLFKQVMLFTYAACKNAQYTFVQIHKRIVYTFDGIHCLFHVV